MSELWTEFRFALKRRVCKRRGHKIIYVPSQKNQKLAHATSRWDFCARCWEPLE